jgi:hypothetical protein
MRQTIQSGQKLVLNNDEMRELLHDLGVRLIFTLVTLSKDPDKELNRMVKVLEKNPRLVHSESFGMINN